MKERERNSRFLLGKVEGIGVQRFKKLLQIFHNATDLLALSYKELIEICGDTVALNIKKTVGEFDAEAELRKLNNLGIQTCVFGDEDYPPSLLDISDPPVCIYYKGCIKNLDFSRCVAVVGTRNISTYGRRVGSDIIKGLIANNILIVSGMAFGVDCLAHALSADSGAPSVAVLASSCDEPTPKTNIHVYNDLLANGGVVMSENPPGYELQSYSFPRRNRIIAGLGLGTVVIEAGEKSGALITANLAFGEGRQVFAVPGNVGSNYSSGTNFLIKSSKAKLIESAEDILVEFGFESRSYDTCVSHYSPKNDVEEKIISSLSSSKLSVEEISRLTSQSLHDILTSIFDLEIEKVVKREVDGRYALSSGKV
jgi:DNA processing protein